LPRPAGRASRRKSLGQYVEVDGRTHRQRRSARLYLQQVADLQAGTATLRKVRHRPPARAFETLYRDPRRDRGDPRGRPV